jgi:hypothetical protein
MQYVIIRPLLLFLLFSCLPTLASAATSYIIHAEWQAYPPSSEPAVIGFNLYREGELTCQVWGPSATAMDCQVSLSKTTTFFTLTVAFNNSTESPHSEPFYFSVLQGFDEDFYLGEKLATLQADPETADDWIGQDTSVLRNVLQEYGFSAGAHYEMYGYGEGLAPNMYFNAAEYRLAKATTLFKSGNYLNIQDALVAFNQAWLGDPYQHYLAYGDEEGVNPSNGFDVSAYLEEKLAALQANRATAYQYNSVDDIRAAFKAAGLTTLGHFLKYGVYEGLSAHIVPKAEQVHPVTIPQ